MKTINKSINFWVVGKNYFIRTVTHHLTGRLESFSDNELILSSAAWIADDGRFADALKNEVFNEVEPFVKGCLVCVNRQSLIDATVIKSLPDQQK